MVGKGLSGIYKKPTLFIVVNKDTAEIYHELVSFDAKLAQDARDRGVNSLHAIQAGEVLPRISRDPKYFECQYGDCKDRCCKEAL